MAEPDRSEVPVERLLTSCSVPNILLSDWLHLYREGEEEEAEEGAEEGAEAEEGP